MPTSQSASRSTSQPTSEFTSQCASRPTSQARIEANRANAQFSTGPRSPEGKARVRYNGVRHGLRADKLLVLHEDAAEFADFLRALLDDLRPVGVVEASLAGQVAAKMWRLRRTHWMEASLLNRDLGAAQHVAMHTVPEKFRIGWGDEPYSAIVGIELGKEMERPHNSYDTLRRYERAAERGLSAALREFQQAQDRRRAGDGKTRGHGDTETRGQEDRQRGEQRMSNREHGSNALAEMGMSNGEVGEAAMGGPCTSTFDIPCSMFDMETPDPAPASSTEPGRQGPRGFYRPNPTDAESQPQAAEAPDVAAGFPSPRPRVSASPRLSSGLSDENYRPNPTDTESQLDSEAAEAPDAAAGFPSPRPRVSASPRLSSGLSDENYRPNPTAAAGPMEAEGLDELNSCLVADLQAYKKNQVQEEEEQKRDEMDELLDRQIQALLKEEEENLEEPQRNEKEGRPAAAVGQAGNAGTAGA